MNLTYSEKYIEQLLSKEVKKIGGLALKFISPGMSGVPDRIVLFPSGRIAFIELKASGEKMRPLQIKRKSQLESLGFLVYCIDSKEAVEDFIKEVMD